MNKLIIILLVLFSFLLLFGCTADTQIPGVPYSLAQFISRTTTTDYNTWISGQLDGNLLIVDFNRIGFISPFDLNGVSSVINFNDLNDVDITNVATGQGLDWNGNYWKPVNLITTESDPIVRSINGVVGSDGFTIFGVTIGSGLNYAGGTLSATATSSTDTNMQTYGYFNKDTNKWIKSFDMNGNDINGIDDTNTTRICFAGVCYSGLTGFVPYTGATSSVNLGASYGVTADYFLGTLLSGQISIDNGTIQQTISNGTFDIKSNPAGVSTTAIYVDENGSVSMPRQSSVYAVSSTTQLVARVTTTRIGFVAGEEQLDTMNEFDGNVFTAKTAGKYVTTCMAGWEFGTEIATPQTYIRSTGTPTSVLNYMNDQTTSTFLRLNLPASATIDLNAGDTIDCAVWHNMSATETLCKGTTCYISIQKVA